MDEIFQGVATVLHWVTASMSGSGIVMAFLAACLGAGVINFVIADIRAYQAKTRKAAVRPLVEGLDFVVRPSCYHYTIIPVESSVTGEDIAAWCPACSTQLGPEWISIDHRARKYWAVNSPMAILNVEATQRMYQGAKSLFRNDRIKV